VAAQVDAKKSTIKADRALSVLKDVDELYVTKGKRVVHLDLRQDKPSADTLKGLLVGPSGNLRAPTLRRGRTLLVGFDHETYARVLT
jgi:arsenate reductase-like glutaredoxin family protein